MMARDVFSLLHFPMMFGVIAYATSLEAAAANPVEPIPLAGRLALALGLALFVGGMAVAIWRATRRFMQTRVILTIATAIAIVGVTGVPAVVTLGIALIGIIAVAVLEQRSSSPIVHELP